MTAKPAPGVDDTILDYTDENFIQVMKETQDIADWGMIPILLGVKNVDLDRIKMNHRGEAFSQHEAIVKAWLNNGDASWAVLVSALRDGLVRKGNFANIIQKNHPKRSGATPKSPNQQKQLNPKPVSPVNHNHPSKSSPGKTLNNDLVTVNAKRIEARLREPQFQKVQGIIFIVGVFGADGTALDVENVESTFRQLNFAVFVVRDPTAEEIACLMEAAGGLDYPYKYEYIAFYFAGHGGIDEDGKPFIIGLQKDNSTTEVMNIDHYIIDPLKPLQDKNLSRLFFFDCCQSVNKGIAFFSDSRALKPKAHAGQLVAYATNAGLKSWGDNKNGGIWTYHFCKNLREFHSEPIGEILSRTTDDVTKIKGDFQQPLIVSSLGRRILHGGSPQTASSADNESPNQSLDSKLLYDKSPTLDDVVEVVTKDCDSQTFRDHLKLLSDCDLKTAFSHWIRTEPTDVTWRNLLKVLLDTSKKHVVKYIINDYLKRPSVYERYINKPNYNPNEDFDL